MLRQLKRLVFPVKKDSFAAYINIDGWLTPAEAKGLFEVAAVAGTDATVLEIGSWKGKSTWCIAHGLQKGTIHCIDPFNAAGEEGSVQIYEKMKGRKSLLDQFKQNMSAAPAGVNVVVHQGYSSDFTGVVKGIDFLFIDGDHSIDGCKYDFEHFQQDVKSNGFIAFHDYYPDRHDLGPTWVVDNMLKDNPAYTHYQNYDSLCVYKKK